MSKYNYYKPVSIGTLKLPGNLFLAPVAGYSNAPFRSICAKMGADFAYTELVSSEALVRASGKTHELLRKGHNEKKYAIQLFGGNPENMAQAAKMVSETYCCDCIDINAGCPMPKITGSCGGSFLMKEVPRLYAVVSAVVRATEPFGIPVSVKIRSGWDDQNRNWRECAVACVDAGAKAITLHPRTRAQRYSGKADWMLIGELVARFRSQVSVFGSGDLFTPEDAADMLEQTACDAVMFARGAMGNPFIFQQTKDLLLTGSYQKEIPLQTRLQAAFDELSETAEAIGEKIACLQMRKKFSSATKGMKHGGAVREQLVRCSTLAEYQAVLQDYLPKQA